MWNKNTLAWYLYDFGRSFLSMNAAVYVSLWLLKEQDKPDIWLTASFVVSTILIIFLSPYLGQLVDRKWGFQRRLLIGLTLGTAVLSIGTYVSGLTHTAQFVFLAILLFTVSNVCDLLSFFIYNTYLRFCATAEARGRVSGFGLAFQTAGSIAGLVATLPIINGQITWFGDSYLSVLIPAALVFLLCALPLLRFRPGVERSTSPTSDESGYQLIRDMVVDPTYRPIARILTALLLLSGAVFTLQLFAAIYLERVVSATDTYKVVILGITLGAIVIGAITGGYLSDRYGTTRILSIALAVASLAMLSVAVFVHASWYPTVFIGLGLSVGAAFATIRALFAAHIPTQKNARFFGLYSLSERTGSIVGPLVWTVVVFTLSGSDALDYRGAVVALAGLILVAWIIVPKKAV